MICIKKVMCDQKRKWCHMFLKYFDMKETKTKSKEAVIEFLTEWKISSVDTSESIFQNYFMPGLKEMIDHLICYKCMLKSNAI